VQIWHESLSSADKTGQAAVSANLAPHVKLLGFTGPYLGLTYLDSNAAVAVRNYWFDDAIISTSSVPVSYFFVLEIICADKYEWDDAVHSCVTPIKQTCPIDGVGKPCDPTTGNEHYTETDYTGAGPFPLTFSRTYNSKVAGNGRLGFNWVSNFGDPTGTNKLLVNAQVTPNFARVSRPDGRTVFFRKVNSVWIPDADITDTLTQTANGWLYAQRNGTVETYDNTTNSLGNSSGRLISITNAAGPSQAMIYNPVTGYLSAITDPFGHSLTFSYDAKGRLSTMTDPNGGITTYTYDDTNNVGNLSAVTYPDGKVRSYKYNEPGYVAAYTNFPHALTGIVDENNNRYASLTYDSYGRVIINQLADVGLGGPQQRFTLSYDSATQTTVTDAASNKVIMAFATNLDVKNLVSKKNLTDNKTLTQTFDPNNNLTCKKDEEGRVTTSTYNASNQKLSQTEGQGGTCAAPVPTAASRTATYQYLAPDLDLPALIETPSVFIGSKKRVAIGYTGNLPTSITQSGFTPSGAAVSRSVTMTYNTSGQVTSINGPRTDVADVTTLAYYDCTTGGGCGQLQRVTNALGQVTTYDNYDANGRLLQMTDPNGVKTVYAYDPRGRVLSLSQTAPGGGSRVTSYGYDAAGNVTSTSLPTGLVLSYTYDAANYLRRVTDSLGNYIDYGYDLKGNRTQTYTYDASGTLVRSVDLAFDARNRVSQINAGGSITQQIADAVGNLTKVTDPNTVAASGTTATNNSYDALNRLFQTVDRQSGSTLYSYDANDRLKTVQAPNGASTQYQYDDLGNLLKEISPDRGTVNYAYDAAGNLTQQTDARGVVSTYAYDALNRLTRIDYPGTTEDVTYTYDSAAGCTFGLGRLCAVVDESGGTAYGYDAFGNALVHTHTELGITYNTFYTYDAGNRVTSITYPDGRVVNTPRDVLGRIMSVATSVNGTAVTLAGNRSFRPDGLLLGQNFGNGVNELRQYDTQGRLTYQSLASADTRLYAYDANGNLKGLQSLPLVGSYNYDGLDRLNLDQRTTTATTSSTFTYDANGNRQSENLGTYAYLANSNRLTSTPTGSITLDAAGNTLSDGTRSYTYNNAGHLSTVAGAGYSYNAQRLRSRKIVGSQGTVYHYDLGGRLIAETREDGSLIRDYVWADDQPVAQIGLTLRGGQPLPPRLPAARLPLPAIEEELVYLHTDHLNTPRLATSPQGQVVWRWEGKAFGDTAPTGSRTVNLRFPGQYWDAESGLFYNWNRYYDPRTGRYLSSDPIGLAGGLNTYAYVFGNPLRWIDPLGLFCTFDFAKHYYTGGGSTIDLGAVGLLGAFQNSASVQGAVGDFKQKVSSTAKAKASSLCKNCDKGTKSTSFNLKDTAETNVTGEPCLFAVGGSTFFRNAGCGVTVNCDNRTFSFGCSLGFSIRDWFRDPIDLGIELPGGTPYRINAGWSESYSGSGSF
jgi:RHS repeat-associated protein